MTHGTYSGYNRHRCRCEPCKEAYRVYRRNRALVRKETRVCSLDDCERGYFSRGYCMRHWRAWRKYGDPLKARRYATVACTFPECDRAHFTKGMCTMHAARARRLRLSPKFSDKGPVQLKLEPILPVLVSLVKTYGTVNQVEKEVGVSKGHLYRMRQRHYPSIHIDLADKLCILAGIHLSDDMVIQSRNRKGGGGRERRDGTLTHTPPPLDEAAAS